SVDTPLVRFLDLPSPGGRLLVEPPLRILVMISSPRNYQPLDVEREWSKLEESLGELQEQGAAVLERLPEPTLEALLRRLRRTEYHVFHFVGHGGFDQQTDEGVLILQDADGAARLVSGQDLGVLLHDHHSLRLATLNACEGAQSSTQDPFTGVAQSLVQQGIP